MTYQKVLGLLLVVVLSAASIQGNALQKRSSGLYDNDMESAAKRSHDELTSRLILRLIDAAIADAEERGVDGDVMGELIRKRGGIRKCFFHAVNCW